MKRFFAGLLMAVGLIIGLAGAAAQHLPFDAIVTSLPWLEFITKILVFEPYWLYMAAGGGAVFIAALAWYILAVRQENAIPETIAASPSASVSAARVGIQESAPSRIMYQADNADIRARVRDLLHRAWGGPLLALILGLLPIAMVHGGVHVFLKPFQALWSAAYAVVNEFIILMGGWKTAAALAATGTLPDLTTVASLWINYVPGIAALAIAWAFIFQPMRVSRAGYFLQLLYGKKPSPLTAFNCFSQKYARALGGMAYAALWLAIWGFLALAVPIGIYVGGMTVINMYPEELNQYLLWLVPSLVGASALAFVAFAWRFIDRYLAYSLVPCVMSSQKSLPARRAMRASKHLMRGHKSRLLGMCLSFLYYFLPTAGALILTPLIRPLGQVFGFTEYLRVTLNRFFLIVIGLNQILWFYVGPVAWASFYAFYLEMKSEFREAHPTRLYILGILPKQPQPYTSEETDASDSLTPRRRRRSAHQSALDDEEPRDDAIESVSGNESNESGEQTAI